MHAPIYNSDLELLTVVWLAPWAVQMLNEHGHIAFAAVPPMRMDYDPDATPQLENWVVRLRGDQLRLGHARTWVLVTEDEELALLLRAAFLPGQQHALRDLESQARREGAAAVLDIIRKLGGDL